jgi:hypothetical protein
MRALRNQMEKISGVVENLRIEKGYQDLIFTKTDSRVAGIAAIGAAAMGQAASASVIGNASAGAEVSMDFFACTVDGMALRGAFHQVEFVNGDHIEFVIEPEGDFFTVHAARSPAARMLWMSQHQIRGINAQKACDLRWCIMYPLLSVLFVIAMEFFMTDQFGKFPLLAELTLYAMMFATTFVITVWIRSRFRGFAYQATEVLRALGYENPEDVDLNQVHKQAQKAMAAATGTLPPLVSAWSYRY